MRFVKSVIGICIALNISYADVIKYDKYLAPKDFFVKGPTIYDKYFMEAAEKYNVPVSMLKAIAKTESNFNIYAVNDKNKNGTVDRGIMQINSIHLNENLTAEDLFDPRINIMMGAKIYKMCFNKYKNELKALNCYNGKLNNNPYGNKVLSNRYVLQTKDILIRF